MRCTPGGDFHQTSVNWRDSIDGLFVVITIIVLAATISRRRWRSGPRLSIDP